MITTSKAIYSDSCAEITFDETNKIVVAKWSGFLKLDTTKKACDAMVKFVKENRVNKHLSDQSTLKVLSKEVQGYLVGEAFPELDKAGLRRLAVLVSEDVFAKATVDNVNNATMMGNIKVKTCNSKKECIEYLNE
ncbi:hypothetical protein PZB74_01120 [Porifericola rhodea]|uniref:MarA n=1 Tax=Porifericola rhodea TaxID=930972 RepID=A0A494WDD1_9BACT|nr:hypothetical protein [Porifericola rhodea]QAV57609.1 MarA [Porifericola rhodea]WKN31957.1 hypothetical protein PZB74_01120 [Porifericola rhodea]